MSTTQPPKKRGTPSDFRGARAEFLGQWSEEYAEASRNKALAKFWPRIFPQYWMNFPWHIELTQEPKGPLFINKDTDWVAPVGAKDTATGQGKAPNPWRRRWKLALAEAAQSAGRVDERREKGRRVLGSFEPSTASQATSAPATQTASSQAVDDIDGAANTSIETLVDDHDNDLTPSSPVRTPAPNPSRKRPVSTPSSPNNGPRNRRKHNAEAASKIVAALQGVAQSLNVVGSPQVRDRAIKMMEEDEDFLESEEPLVMRLFTKDIAIVQTYIAATKKSRRTAFIRSLLEETVL
ncbi:hypothetical protein B0H14DRAFT_3452097 [Mycena olivaceomarginata]|nr:hypothetical protein B0H14DRAFT_3452097 [Mycena olivaceomarginata]